MILSKNTTLTGNGIGTLTDAVSAVVTHEINGQYELMMTYPVTGIHYADLEENRIIWAEPDNMTAQQAFRIYRITRPLNGIVTVYARHLAYDMSGIIVEPYTASSLQTALSGITSHCVPSCPFTFTTSRAAASLFTVSQPTALWSLLGGQQGSFLDVYGGEWAFDNYAATLTSHLGADRGVSVRYGKNMTELEQDLTIEATYVGVYPFWYDEETDTLVNLPEKIITTTGTGNRILILDCSSDFETQPTVAQLRTKANTYITANNIGEPQISWKVSFAQLAQDPQYASIAALEQVQLGDTIKVYYEPMELEASSRAVKIEYDVLMQRYKSVTLGRVKQNLAAIVAGTNGEIQKAVSAARTALDRAIENSTDFIKNGTGYMRSIYNSSGDLMEIVSLDNPDINLAQKVWRWNNGGFGFSSTGYNGTYTTAITQDGSIVADFITTGTLNAARIKAGVLADEAGKFSLNLVTGELHIEQLDVVAEKLSNIGGRNYAWSISPDYHPDLLRAQNCTYTYNPENNGEYVLTSQGGAAFPQIWHRGRSTTGYPVPDELKGTKVTWHCDYISASGADPSPRAYIGFRKNNADQYILSLNPERLSYTFTVPSDCEQMYVLLRVRQDGTNINGETMTVRGLKLERGEVATDWTPAPEDDASAIAANKAAIEVNAEGISSKVSQEDYNGQTIASLINQTATDASINAQKINLTGYVTASSLTASGTTTIDGSRITTGYISADRIAASSITAAKINLSDLFSQRITATNMTITGGYVNITGLSSSDTSRITLGAADGRISTMSPIGFRLQYKYEEGSVITTAPLAYLYSIGPGSSAASNSYGYLSLMTNNSDASANLEPNSLILKSSLTSRLQASDSSVSLTDGTSTGTLYKTLINLTDGTKTYSFGTANGLFMYAGSSKYSALIWPDSNGAGRFVLGDGTSTKWRTELTNSGLFFRNASDTVTAQYPADGLYAYNLRNSLVTTLPASGSKTITFSGQTVAIISVTSGYQQGYATYVYNGYGTGTARQHIAELHAGTSINYAIDASAQKVTITNGIASAMNLTIVVLYGQNKPTVA